MLTVPEAARRAGRSPETTRRSTRAGRLRSQKAGTRHLVDEADLDALMGGDDDEGLPLPPAWKTTYDRRPMPNWVRIIREQPESH